MPIIKERATNNAARLFEKNKHIIKIKQKPTESIRTNGRNANEQQSTYKLFFDSPQSDRQNMKYNKAVSMPLEPIFSNAGLAVAQNKIIRNDVFSLKPDIIVLVLNDKVIRKPPAITKKILVKLISTIAESVAM